MRERVDDGQDRPRAPRRSSGPGDDAARELNASSFTARVAASTEADPYACVTAALATVSGRRHGSASEAIALFADDIGGPDGARAAVAALRKRDAVPPG